LVSRRVKRNLVQQNIVNGRVKDYRFVDEKRKNIPDAGLASYYVEKLERKKYEYDPYLDPQLYWAGKTEHASFEADTVALHIHERISTRAILKIVEKQELLKQFKLFGEPDLPLNKRIEFYKHDMDWTNRLILGDCLLVMNSLLEKEMMEGKVQMIYMDPPYAISYDSNFMPTIRQREVKDDDSSLTREVEQIKAYRDTWQLGIHSYLTYLRDRLWLCRKLLHKSGSIFVQINDENLHLVQNILDEVFGRENFVAMITFTKTRPVFKSKYLLGICDYLLWYAKSKENLKYHQLFFPKDPMEELNVYNHILMPDGNVINTPRDVSKAREILSRGGILFMSDNLVRAQNPEFPFEFKGQTYVQRWRTNPEGMKRLAEQRRIYATKNQLRYIYRFDDFPAKIMGNIWDDVIGEPEKIFVVQTNTKIVERCILMTTDPSDLVLDPTCGSGTTAFCAEKWGRRWITIDTSRVALFLARQRLLSATFPYYRLAHPEQNVSGGFTYETVPHITLKSITRDEPAETATLYDKPLVESDKVRISGPFTVEAIPVPSIQDALPIIEEQPNQPTNVAEEYVSVMVDLMRRDGITFPGGKRITLDNIRAVESAGFLHAEAQIKQDGNPARVALSFGPRYGPVTSRQVEEVVRSAYMMGFSVLILAGFAFDPEVSATIQKNPHPNLQIHIANIRPDVEMSNLLKSPRGSQLFTVFGQPDVKIKKVGEEYMVELLGVDIYDPTEGDVHPSRPEDVAAWFLDQNYDGYTFCITQAFFPKEATNRNPWDKLENALHGVIDKERMENLRGTISLPFKAGDQKRIAGKVIDQRGNEVIVVKKLEKDVGERV
jgi:adenine-specific DNA-methyltransferase